MTSTEATQPRRRTQEELNPPRQVLTLVLRPDPLQNGDDARLGPDGKSRRITWDRDVREVENQKVSKCCCVFHKKRLFGESDSDDSSSSDSSDGDEGNGPAPSEPHHAGDGGCCDDHHHHHHAERTTEGAAVLGEVVDSNVLVIKRKKKRPQCTKEHCYCGTRFS